MPRKRVRFTPQREKIKLRIPPSDYTPSIAKCQYIARYVWNRDIGLIVKAARVNLGYTRTQLAILTDNSYNFMQNIEDGGIDSLKADTVIQLCRYLHLTIEKIFPSFQLEESLNEPLDFW